MNSIELPADVPIPTGLALRLGASLAFHPFEYSKVLIQLGHEPLAPRNTKTMLGKPALAYPSVFQYCGHIRRRDGLLGLWRGVTPKMLSLAVAHLASDKFNQMYPPEPELKEEEEEAMSMEDKQERFVKMTLRDIACKMTCVIVSQPLHVLAVRSMAEFVGGEDKFSGGLTAGLYGGCVSIVQENGILGFWSGLLPRMLGEVGILGLTASITYLVNNYLLDDKEMKQYTGHVAGFLAGSLCYPLQVTSTCMTVSRSGLMAGYPPRMPLYTGWLDCLSHLRSQGQLKRGSSLIFRYYTGPQVIVGDRVIPANSNMFKSPLKQQ